MIKSRDEILDKYKWDLTDYFKNEQEWEITFLEIKQRYEKIAYFEGKLDNEKDIFACLDFFYEITEKMSKLYVYAALKTKEDLSNSKNQELIEKISSLQTQFSAVCSFIEVELSNLSDELLNKLRTNKQYSKYNRYFYDILRFKPHNLSKKEEKLLSLMSDFESGFADNFEKLDNADLIFDKIADSNNIYHELNHSNYNIFMESPDRILRKNAFLSMHNAYKKLNNFLANNYINDVKVGKFVAKVRNYSSLLQASIFGEEASEKVYDTLINEVHKALPLFYRYFDIKKNQLNLSKFAIYDVYAKSAQNFGLKVDYEQAFEIIKNATRVLGDDYINLLERAKNEKWIDVLPSKGKDSGAFSWGAYGAHPVVLLNFVNNTNSVFTLAHELGHCLHTYYSNANQPFPIAHYTIFVAEVASTVNEMLLVDYLIKNSKSNEEKIFYYDHLLSTARATILRQTMFSEFEEFAHNQVEQDLPISKDILNNFYFELNKKYFGDKVEVLDEVAFEWSRIPHFFSSFYVYKYATGLICALSIVSKILQNDKEAILNYKNFLTKGCSKSPIELLKIAGVDLESKTPFEHAFKFLSNILDEWENINKKNS